MNTLKRICLLSFGLLLSVAFVHSTYSQVRVDSYYVTNFMATWSDISGVETRFTYVPDSGTSWNASDEGIGAVTLPFDFPYDGQVVPAGTVMNASTNGCVVLRPTGFALSANGAYPAPYLGSPDRPGVLAFALADDACPELYDYYLINGTAPNRVLTIEFHRLSSWNRDLPIIKAQVKLYENGTIEYIYFDHDLSFTGSDGPIGVGLDGFSTPTFVYQAYDGSDTQPSTPSTDIRWSPTQPAPPSELSLESHTLNFGRLTPGDRDTLCVTATGLGPGSLKVTGFNLSGDPQFRLISSPVVGDTVLANSTRSWCFEFMAPNNNDSSTRSATFTIETDGLDSGTQTVTLIGSATTIGRLMATGEAGSVATGDCQNFTVTLTNYGDTAWTSGFPAIGGPDAEDYTIVNSLTPNPVPPGGTATITMQFCPSRIGEEFATLTYPSSGFSYVLSGTGVGVTVTATGTTWTLVQVGNCKDFTVTLTNTGSIPWSTGTAVIGGVNPADFTILSGPDPDTIPAGETSTVEVEFCPTINGSETATLTFPSSSPTPLGGFSYVLSGTGAGGSGVNEKSGDQGFELGQSYPNPTTGSAVVMFTLPTDAPVRIDLIDALGSIVRTVFAGRMSSGDHSMTLNAKDLASGTYFYTLTSGDIHLTRQMILVR